MAKGQLFGVQGVEKGLLCCLGYPYTPIIRCSQDGKRRGQGPKFEGGSRLL